MDRVFDKFHRVEDPLRMTTSGTGLGLYIARQLTAAMAGTLTLTSTLGSGSTFCFTMPITPVDAAAPDEPDRAGFGPFAGLGPGLPRPRRRAVQAHPEPALPAGAVLD